MGRNIVGVIKMTILACFELTHLSMIPYSRLGESNDPLQSVQ